MLLFTWISVFKALCSKCILLLLLQHPNSILLLLSMFWEAFVYVSTRISLYSSAFFLFTARDRLMGQMVMQVVCCKTQQLQAWCRAGYGWAQMQDWSYPAGSTPKCLSVRRRVCLCVVSREALEGVPGTHWSFILLRKRDMHTQTLCTYTYMLALCGEDLAAANTTLWVCRWSAADDH